jgi:membrane-associated phospholipid phosphatase
VTSQPGAPAAIPARERPAITSRLRYGRPLLPSPARRWVGGLLACCVIVVVVLGVLFHGQTGPDRLDHAVDAPIISGLGGHPSLALRLADPGTMRDAVVLSAVIVVAGLLTRRINGAILAAAAVPAATGLTEDLIKPLVHRTYLGVLSYPSGHTAAAGAMAATVTVLLLASPQLGRFTVLRVLIPAAAWVVVAAVAVGVMAVRFHYFTDTLAGAAVGTVTVCALAFALDLAQALFGRAFAAP